MFMTTALRKNLLALIALGLAVLLFFLYLGLFPSSSTSTPPLDPMSLWQVPVPDPVNVTAGYAVINTSAIVHATLFSADNRSLYWGTYSHHPHIRVVNTTSSLVLVSFSNHLVDEDADGQQVLYRHSVDGGASWSTPLLSLFPPALLPTQTPSAWRSNSLQRAMCSEGFVQLEGGRTFAIAELYGSSNVTGIPREGTGIRSTGFGRVAREINSTDGRPIGGPCWLQPSRFAGALQGTPYDPNTAAMCDDADLLLPLLSQGAYQPAWSWALMSDAHHVHANNASTDVAEPTHAAVFNASTACRFWRLLSALPASANRTLYMECTNATDSPDASYNGWFNGTDETVRDWYGPYPSITPTNIPDANSKSFFAAFPASSASDRSTYASWRSAAPLTHYLISNPRADRTGDRFPLTIATSTDNSTFNAIASLHATPPPSPRFPGRYKNPGYQYPAAAVAQRPAVNGTSMDVLLVVYSVGKEDIQLSSVRVVDLPRGVAPVAEGSGSSFGKGFVFFVLVVAAVVAVGALVWWFVWAPLSEAEEEEMGVAGEEAGGPAVIKGASGGDWVDKRVPLTSDGGDEYYEEGDEEDEEEEDDEDGEYEDDVEEKNAHAIVTSADVAHYVAPPRTAATRTTKP